jgi:soluble lytic murein transglycosylase-like protein
MDFRILFNRVVLVLLAVTCGPSALALPRKPLENKIFDAAQRASLDPKLVEAIIKVESNFSTKATSPKGAKGLMQVMASTARECKILDPYHPLNNLMGACVCLRKLINRYRGDLKLALAAYNAGPSNVDKYGGIPPFPETQDYVKRVLENYEGLATSDRLVKGKSRP